MNPQEKQQIIHGNVFVDGRWVSIDQKVAIERERRKKIEAGYVYFQQEWMTIDEKLRRVHPPAPPAQKDAGTVIINNYDNRTFTNIDNRTMHHHEHQHVHLDQNTLEGYMHNRLPGEPSPTIPLPDSDEQQQKTLPEKKRKKMIDDEGKNRKLLLPPDAESDR